MITVIVPNFNNSKYVAETIQSIKNQTYKNFKCIIIDDKSLDNSIQIISENIKNDNRFTFIQNEKNNGVAFSRNVGILNSTTEFILPLDSDDMIEKTYLERICNFFIKNPQYTLYYGKWHFFGYDSDSQNKKLGNLKYNGYKNLLYQNSIHCSCAFRKNDAIQCGLYDSQLNGFEDWEFLIRLLNNDKLVFYDKTVSLYYRRHQISRNTNVDSNLMYKYIINKNINIYRKYFLI